jgi:2-succinyl-5-enolpyruvyl-6-hydroxy-3-cyclohexene-1-carboxylate synthase
MKTFTTREIAQIKRTAQNVAPIVAKRDRVLAKVKELYKELETLDAQIDAWETAVKAMTNGFTTNDLVDRVVNETTTAEGKVVKTVTYVLKFPDTVVPAESPVETSSIPFDGCPMPVDECLGEPDGPCASVVDNN